MNEQRIRKLIALLEDAQGEAVRYNELGWVGDEEVCVAYLMGTDARFPELTIDGDYLIDEEADEMTGDADEEVIAFHLELPIEGVQEALFNVEVEADEAFGQMARKLKNLLV